jgi:hypothetical protein
MCNPSTTTSSTPPEISLPIDTPPLLMDKNWIQAIGVKIIPKK